MIDRRYTALVVRLWRQHRVALLIMAAGLALFEFVITRIAPEPGEAGFLSGILALMPPQVSAFASGELALGSPRGVIAFQTSQYAARSASVSAWRITAPLREMG